MSRTVAVAAQDLSFDRGGRSILRGVSLTVAEGSFLGIVGPNGGGKTTLLRLILGLLHPSSGGITVFGSSPERLIGSGVIGHLPQHVAVEREFPASALDVVLMGRYRPGRLRYDADDRNEAERFLGYMGMADRRDRPFASLSGGEQQRVAIARALVSGPRLLVLDEPSTGVDVIGQDDFYELLRDIRRELGLTVVMVSHDIGAISSFVDDLACLNVTLHYHGRPDGINEAGLLARLYGRDVDFIHHHAHCVGCQRLHD